PAVGLDDRLADRKAETDAADAGMRAPEELLEDGALGPGRESRTAIPHVDLYAAVASDRLDLDRRSVRRVLERVLEQVHEHLLEEDRVDRDERDTAERHLHR